MIEIIREENWDDTQEKAVLPKNIKQIGTPDIGERIYIEHLTYQQLHPYETMKEKTGYVLLGKFEDFGGRQCIFIQGAIMLKELEFDGQTPIWNDDTWAYLYKNLKHAYDEMVIVGWALDMKGQLPNLTLALEKLHRMYFGGPHQILYLMDSLEKEEAFYGLKNGSLCKREGYYIYYDKSMPERLDHAMESLKEENVEKEIKINEETTERRETIEKEPKKSIYREYIKKKEQRTKRLPAYSSSILMMAVIAALSFAGYQNYEKLNAMEETIAKMNQEQTIYAAQTTEQDKISVETIEGNVVPVTETEQSDAPVIVNNGDSAQNEADIPAETSQNINETDLSAGTIAFSEQENNTETAAVENQNTEAGNTTEKAETINYVEQGYYIVEKGDSLVGICQKIYQTTAMMDKLCEVNGIENPDAIYEGQYLTLPK